MNADCKNDTRKYQGTQTEINKDCIVYTVELGSQLQTGRSSRQPVKPWLLGSASSRF